MVCDGHERHTAATAALAARMVALAAAGQLGLGLAEVYDRALCLYSRQCTTRRQDMDADAQSYRGARWLQHADGLADSV